ETPARPLVEERRAKRVAVIAVLGSAAQRPERGTIPVAIGARSRAGSRVARVAGPAIRVVGTRACEAHTRRAAELELGTAIGGCRARSVHACARETVFARIALVCRRAPAVAEAAFFERAAGDGRDEGKD